jgi:acylphosphatase
MMNGNDINGLQRLTARARGRVQGVGFRMFVRREAGRLGLSGYVRNCEDGAVETVAEGPEERLRELEARLRSGPPGSRVEAVESRWAPAAGEFRGFQIRD